MGLIDLSEHNLLKKQNEMLADIIKALLHRVGGKIEIMHLEMLENRKISFELINNPEEEKVILLSSDYKEDESERDVF